MVVDVRPAPEQAHKASRALPAKGFRPDVEGLRAVAVGLVLLYHAGLPFVPGGFVGVDVFFVISGFLITGLLVKEVRRSGTVSLKGFYARRAKRLLPAASAALAATALLTLAFVPRTRWTDIGGDIIASALYFVNWRLADRSVDYLAEGSGASPVQHFWSLAVEEQYYLIWPLLMLLATVWVKRTGRSLGSALWIGLALVAVPSFAWSIYQTANDHAVAFFVTTTRMWELAIGAAVALGITALARMPRQVAVVLGWSGLAAVVLSAFIYSTGSAWPGYSALLPTLGTAAVIAAGQAAGSAGPVAILGTPAFTWVGGLSYSLYLWHWPLIAIAAAHWGGLTPTRGLAIALLCVIPAWLTSKLVENPIRFSTQVSESPGLALRIGAVLTIAGVLAGLTLVAGTALRSSAEVSNAPGAAALGKDPASYRPVNTAAEVTPDPLKATKDVPDSYARGCQVDQVSAEPTTCVYGDPSGDVRVALVGDSKALQWITALDTIGKERGWRITTFTKSSCPFTAATISQNSKPYENCRQHGQNVLDRLVAEKPDVMITSQARGVALADPADVRSEQSADVMRDGLRERWSALVEAGVPVVVLRENPTPPAEYTPVYECVDEHREDLAACTFARVDGERLGSGDSQLAAAKGLAGVSVLDLNDYVCPGTTCPPVIGKVLVYRQGSHLTTTYVDSLRPLLEDRLVPLVER